MNIRYFILTLEEKKKFLEEFGAYELPKISLKDKGLKKNCKNYFLKDIVKILRPDGTEYFREICSLNEL